MRLAVVVLLAIATPATAQVTAANQAEFLARAEQQGKVIEAMVAAAKAGDDRSFQAAVIPNAVYMASHWRISALSLRDIEARAKECRAQVTMDPEVIGGRVTLHRDKAAILWQCPAAPALEAKSVVEFDGMKIAFVRTFDGTSPIVTVAEPR